MDDDFLMINHPERSDSRFPPYEWDAPEVIINEDPPEEAVSDTTGSGDEGSYNDNLDMDQHSQEYWDSVDPYAE